MAIPIKHIPTLKGELGRQFIMQSDERAKRRGTKCDPEKREVMRSIIAKSKINHENGLDLEVLESKLNNALDNETEESLSKWLTEKRDRIG